MAHLARNILIGAVATAVVGGLAYVTFRPEPVPVDLHTIARGDFVVTVDVDGVTRVSELYEVAAPISGVALRAPVDVGDRVIEGETVVARVEPASPGLLDTRTRLQAEAAVREAEATLAVAQVQRTGAQEDFNHAKSEYERVRELVQRGVSTVSRLEDMQQGLVAARSALDAAEARILQAESTLARTEAALVESRGDVTNGEQCCVTILAPASGVVLARDIVSQQPVTLGTRLLTIGDPANLELVADLLSADAVRLPEGATAHVERWGGPPLEARLLRVEPAARTKVSALGIEEQRVDAIFEITSPPEQRSALGDGFAVFLRIVEYSEENALLIPLSSVFRVGDGWSAFRAKGERVERVPIEIGRHNGRHAVVLSGLSEGDEVVEHPSEALIDGALFTLRTEM